MLIRERCRERERERERDVERERERERGLVLWCWMEELDVLRNTVFCFFYRVHSAHLFTNLHRSIKRKAGLYLAVVVFVLFQLQPV